MWVWASASPKVVGCLGRYWGMKCKNKLWVGDYCWSHWRGDRRDFMTSNVSVRFKQRQLTGIYLVECNNGYWKIGYSVHIHNRVKAYDDGKLHSYVLVPYESLRNAECALQHYVSNRVAFGHEWFVFDEADVRRVQAGMMIISALHEVAYAAQA